jgi:hypothetical protein
MRPPSSRELFGGEAEVVLRDWLAWQFLLSPERIVEYHEHRGRSTIRKYRELDALIRHSPQLLEVFEIKASRSATSLRRAVRQLRETRTLLQMLVAEVAVTILFVDTGVPTEAEVAELMQAPDAPPDPPETIDDILTHFPDVVICHSLDKRRLDKQAVNLLFFQVTDIVSLAGTDQLHLNWDDEEDLEQNMPRLQSVVEPVDLPEPNVHETHESPFAAILRQALNSSRKNEQTHE